MGYSMRNHGNKGKVQTWISGGEKVGERKVHGQKDNNTHNHFFRKVNRRHSY